MESAPDCTVAAIVENDLFQQAHLPDHLVQHSSRKISLV
jgi:hypothetical protein